MSVDKSIRYYAATGPDNTEDTLQLAKARADALGITNVVVASTRGHTGVKAVNLFTGCTVVIVPHVTGMRGPGVQELSEDLAEQIRADGGKIVIAAYAFSGVNRALQA